MAGNRNIVGAARLAYMPQLDALRAVAIGAVLVAHWGPKALTRLAPWGPTGVRLFFVLSGFLITGILIHARQAVDDGRASSGSVAWRFYVRRVLRIFPIYYLTLAVTAALDLPGVRQTLWWHASYLTNIYVARSGQWPGSAAHFWSLAAEEQFYLAWPWLILFLPRRALRPAILGAIGLGVAALVVTWALGWSRNQLGAEPLAALPPLALGALLALLSDGRWGNVVHRARLCRWSLIAGWAFIAGAVALRLAHRSEALMEIGLILGVSGVASWLIDRASRGFGGPVGRVLEYPPLLYLGAISYGIYVIHLFVAPAFERALGPDWAASHGPMTRLACYATTTIALASASWFLLERPINSLKRFVPYIPQRPAPAPSRVTATHVHLNNV